MDCSSVLGHIFLQSDLWFAIPSHGGSLNLSYSTQTRLHQLLQVQHLHERLWKTRRYTLRKRMRKERKSRQQTGHSGFYSRFAISSSNSDFFIFAYKIFFYTQIVSADLPFRNGYLQFNYLAQLFNT